MSLDPRHREDYLEFLRFASVSTDLDHAEATRACAEWLRNKLKAIGLETTLHETKGQPALIGRTPPDPEKKTVLIYGHYDVQPPDPVDLWTHPPFEPHIENGLVYARGATDNKGQIFAHLIGLEQQLAGGRELPVNVAVLIEGEEEIGSPNLLPLIEDKKDELACDVVVISDTSMVAEGVPTFTYGLRGICGVNVDVTGPSKDLHSGFYGGAVMNPVTALARMIASLHDDDESVAVKGFYDNVQELAEWERKAWARLPAGDATLKAESGAPRIVGEVGYTGLECVWGRPTCELNGFYGGYQGPGGKTVLPSRAHAKITCRLVPEQDPKAITVLLSDHLKQNAPPGVKVEITPGHGGRAYFVDPNVGYGKAAQEALRETFDGADPALIREGGSIPIVCDFQDVLGADTLLLGLALPGCNMHSPDESFPLAHLELGAELNATLLAKIAAVEPVTETSGK
ncbi:MAG: dipeptidase [Verrucomicrobiota bacterium]